MVLSPDNGAEDRSSQLDEPLEWLVNMLLELDITEISDNHPTLPDSSTKSPPTSDRPETSDVSGGNGKSVGERELVALSPDAEAESDSHRQSASGSPSDLKYVWFYLKSLESKLQNLRLDLDDSSIANPQNRERLQQAILPFLDEAIHQRGMQERVKMGAAIAQILPTAISHQIEHYPTSIAKSIAPELAIAIQEQIKLDPASISTSLGPQMGDAIKNQILVEREAMVDALYPVIGNTISKYMVEMVQSINEKVESAFSVEGMLRKIRAKLQGVTEAELILQESVGYKIQAVLLIHKASGLVIREIQPEPDFILDTDMMAGMLTAIRSFVNDCMSESDVDSELHQIEYSASKILLEVAGYCYLAIAVKGNPSTFFIAKIRENLGKIVLESGKAIANYNGDPDTIPKTVDLHLNSLIISEPIPKSRRKFPAALVILLGAIAFPLAILGYKNYIASQIEAKMAEALDSVPELSIYRIEARVRNGILTLTGRLPNEYLRHKAEVVSRQIAPNWSLENKILAVEVPPEPIRTAGEVKRLTSIYNRTQGTAIATQHDFGSNSVTITGAVAQSSELQQILAGFKQIPGITTIASTVQIRPVLETRLYFNLNSTAVDSPQNTEKLKFIRQFLDRNPGINVKIIAHSDGIGEEERNRQLSSQRARQVQQALIDEGINPVRLQIEASDALPPGVTPREPSRLRRTVRFEVFVPNNS